MNASENYNLREEFGFDQERMAEEISRLRSRIEALEKERDILKVVLVAKEGYATYEEHEEALSRLTSRLEELTSI